MAKNRLSLLSCARDDAEVVVIESHAGGSIQAAVGRQPAEYKPSVFSSQILATGKGHAPVVRRVVEVLDCPIRSRQAGPKFAQCSSPLRPSKNAP